MPRALEPKLAGSIVERVRDAGFLYVTLDLEGYRQGSLNAALEEKYNSPCSLTMDKQDILELLEAVRAGRASVAQGVERLRHLPYEDLGFAKIDHHRGLRQGFAEVIYAKGKTPAQVVAILRGMLAPASDE